MHAITRHLPPLAGLCALLVLAVACAPAVGSTAAPAPAASVSAPAGSPSTTAVRTASATPSATRGATTTSATAIYSPTPNVPSASGQTYESTAYHYSIVVPAGWSAKVEHPGARGDAQDIERVTLSAIAGGASIMIEAAGNAYSASGVNCANRDSVVAGLKGCRFSLPAAQNPAQELVLFTRSEGGPAATWSYFVVQLVYSDKQSVDTFNQMLATWQFTTPTAPQPTPHGDGPPPTALPTPHGDGSCTYRASFVSDVTLPDGSSVAPGARLSKTWRVRNGGTCSWGAQSYALHSLVFVAGDPLGAPASVEIPVAVAPGATVDLSVALRAPAKPGTYHADWKLKVESGPLIGVGTNGDVPLSVSIVVK